MWKRHRGTVLLPHPLNSFATGLEQVNGTPADAPHCAVTLQGSMNTLAELAQCRQRMDPT